MEQIFFKYSLDPNLGIEDFFVSQSNLEAYNILLKSSDENKKILLLGPKKSGKTHLGLIWKNKNNAITYKKNLNFILENKKAVFIDNLFSEINETNIFHIINHCNLNNLKILITSEFNLSTYQFKIVDLSSRLKTFVNSKIYLPDDNLLVNLIMKLLSDKQIVIRNHEIFNYILKRVDRSYQKVFLLVEKIDQLSLVKKRELTIPLIKELL